MKTTWKIIKITLLFLVENSLYIVALIVYIKGNNIPAAIFLVLLGIGSDVQLIKKELKNRILTDEEKWLLGRRVK